MGDKMNYGCKKEINDKRDFKMKTSKIAKINTFPKEYKIKMNIEITTA